MWGIQVPNQPGLLNVTMRRRSSCTDCALVEDGAMASSTFTVGQRRWMAWAVTC